MWAIFYRFRLSVNTSSDTLPVHRSLDCFGPEYTDGIAETSASEHFELSSVLFLYSKENIGGQQPKLVVAVQVAVFPNFEQSSEGEFSANIKFGAKVNDLMSGQTDRYFAGNE